MNSALWLRKLIIVLQHVGLLYPRHNVVHVAQLCHLSSFSWCGCLQAKQAVDAMLSLAKQAGLQVLQYEGLADIATPATNQACALLCCCTSLLLCLCYFQQFLSCLSVYSAQRTQDVMHVTINTEHCPIKQQSLIFGFNIIENDHGAFQCCC